MFTPSVQASLAVPVGAAVVKRHMTRDENGIVHYHREYLFNGQLHSVSQQVRVSASPVVNGVAFPVWKLQQDALNRK